MFYSTYGVDRIPLQSEVGKPILRVNCNYYQSHECLDTSDSSTSIPENFLYGNKDTSSSMINTKDENYLAYLKICNKCNNCPVNCPKGWFHSTGYCLKAVEDTGFSNYEAKTKCEDLGGFILPPMNEQYTKDIEDLLKTSKDDLMETDFWIGNQILALFESSPCLLNFSF